MTEDAKIHFLFKKVQHQGLESAVEAMKAKITTEPARTVTYTTVANHISTVVSELPDFLSRNRKVSAVKGKVTYGNATNYNIFNVNNSVNNGHHAYWLQMGQDNRKIVNNERTRLGYGRVKSKNKTPHTHRNSSRDDPANVRNTIAQLRASVQKHGKVIASLKRGKDVNQAKPDDADIEDAGNSFGGKAKKSKNKS